MVFSNLFFIYLFLPLNLILYFISSNKTWRNGVLLAFSFFFYAWGEPVWVFMLMLTAFLDYTWARCIEYFAPHDRHDGPDLAGSLAAV